MYSLDGAGEIIVNASRQQYFYDEFEAAGLTMNSSLANWYKGDGTQFKRGKTTSNGVNVDIKGETWEDIPASAKNRGTFGQDSTAIFIVGRMTNEAIDLPPLPSGSGTAGLTDNDYLQFTTREENMIENLCNSYDKVIVLFNQANPMQEDLPEILKNVEGVMWIGFPGSDGIKAVADLLVGKSNPSGGLSDMWYSYADANPSMPNYGLSNNVVMAEGMYLGYRYAETRYEDLLLASDNAGTYDYSSAVSYPFGYGLSYTDFSYTIEEVIADPDPAKNHLENDPEKDLRPADQLRATGDDLGDCDDIIVRVRVRNTGSVAGKQNIQIYLQQPITETDKSHGVEKPSVELVGFGKTSKLEANGGEEVIDIKIDANKLFAAYDRLANGGKGSYVLSEGTYYLVAASNSHEAVNSILKAKDSGIQGIDAEGKQRAFLNRLVLATSLGLTVKKTFDGKPATVFVQHLGTGLPLEGVQIQVLGSNGVSLVTGVTDAQGRAQLPPVEGLPRDVLPAAIVARTADGQDTAWLSLRDFARTVDYSDFPVAGRHVSPDGMIVSAFSQRDIYRPGERLHFGCILRKADGTPLPEGVPLEVELIDPRPATVLRRSLTTDRDGLFVLDWDSPADAITGPYRLSVRLAGDRPVFLGDVAVRVEEFQPDTLSIKANFSPAVPRGWFRTGSGETPTASVRLDNLYGQPAAGHRVSAAFQTAAGTFRFEEYSDYTFYDASPFNGESTSLRMSDATTDASGTALLPLPLGRLLPGTFRGTVQIEGFEPSGGRAVTRSLNALFSPQALALGWKPEGGANNLEYIPQHTAGSLRLLAVNNDLQPVAVEKAQLILSERRYVTSLVSDAQGRYRYDAASVDTEVQRSEAVIGPDGFLWSIPTETPGDYLLSVRDAEGTLLASIPFSIAGNRLAAPEELDPASLARGNLRLVLDKKRYAPGDVIKMRLSAPFDGSGLITIERDNVVAHAWFTAKAGESVQEITLPRDFEGAGYVNVSFVRSQQSDAIYMQPHAYAVAPFTAGVEQRDMGLRLEAPASVRPGEELRVRLSARTPGRAVVFAVDEGILQLTDFRTPDPLADILLDRALGVQTSRMFDLLMPDHARLRGRIPGFGGGVGVGARFLNPFQRRGEAPFAVWLDPVDVGPEGRELTIAVPESFTGKFRLMAVGCAAPSSPSVTAGNAETFVEVNGTIIVKPLLPSTVAPGDTFEGALAIANTVAGSGPEAQVQLTLKTGSGLELRDTPAEQTVVIPENGEKVIPLPLRALDEPGVTSVTVVATQGKEKPVQRSIELAIRPATPRTLTLSERVVDKQRDISAPSALYPYQAVTRATLSTGPLSALRAVFARLNAYPYDCTEQRISQAFPYAALSAVPELRASVLSQAGLAPEEKDKDAMGRRVAAAVQGIQRCFVVNDGVSFWPGGKADDFLTAYAADFLLTLRENGSIAPEPLTRNLLDALQRLAVRPPTSAHDARIKIYAVWVLLRDGRIMTQEVRELERWCRANLPDWERDAVATLLADSLAMLRLERQARDILPPRIAAPASDSVFTPAILHGLHALALSRHFPERRVDIPVDSLVRYAVTDASPLELSFLARGLLTLGGTPPPLPPDVRLTCTEVAPGFPPVTAEAVAEGSVLTLDAPGCTRVETSAPAGEGWRLQLLTDGYPRTPQPEKAQGLEVRRRFLDERGEAVLSAPVGALLTVEITLRSDNTTLENIVITDLLPGGLELLLEKDDSLPQGDGLLYRQRREDRSLFFVNATPAAATYRYRVRAATRGTVALPPVSAEAMYDAATRAAADGGQFVVE